MKAQIYYTLDTDDQFFVKQFGDCLNMINFVFTHHPELKPVTKEERKKTKVSAHPHKKIIGGGGNPFTAEELRSWSNWVDEVIAKGRESIMLQHPAYRDGHAIALDRFRETADDFLHLCHSV